MYATAREHTPRGTSPAASRRTAVRPLPAGANLLQRKACACGGTCPRCRNAGGSAAFTVSQPGDRDELEADHMADRVLQSSDVRSSGNPGNDVPRRTAPPPGLSPGDTGKPLPDSVRTHFEPRFGLDFTQVRLHDDPQARQTAARLDARAFTIGGHIWLGQRESPSDSRLMAHELAHVAQQTTLGPQAGAAPRLQRERLPCTSQRIIDVYAINLPGSSRNPSTDLAQANDVWCQCGIEFNLAGGQSWSTTLLDTDAPSGVLNEIVPPGTPTAEVTQMTGYRPGGDVIHVYYVPSNSLGDRGGSYGYAGAFPGLPPSVSVTNIGAVDTLAHELGHVMMADPAHNGDPANLMASGGIRRVGVDELTTGQCARV